jgi:hypothetical protein
LGTSPPNRRASHTARAAEAAYVSQSATVSIFSPFLGRILAPDDANAVKVTVA